MFRHTENRQNRSGGTSVTLAPGVPGFGDGPLDVAGPGRSPLSRPIDTTERLVGGESQRTTDQDGHAAARGGES